MNERMDKEFRAHLASNDSDFLEVIALHPVLELPSPRPPFEALVRIVAGQQLSVKAAATVFGRVKDSLSGDVSVESLQRVDPASLRAAGLSGAKTASIMALAEFAGLGEQRLHEILDGSWTDARDALLSVRGIGPWSVDMYAMFGLGRPDIFAPGDLGLRIAMEKHLGIPEKQKPAVYDQRALRWSPYRTLASLHLWHSLKPDHERYAR
jgi:DNA-3-methyladenine glycosylase II